MLLLKQIKFYSVSDKTIRKYIIIGKNVLNLNYFVNILTLFLKIKFTLRLLKHLKKLIRSQIYCNKNKKLCNEKYEQYNE